METLVESLKKIFETINSPTHEFLLATTMLFQLIFAHNPSFQNTSKTNISLDQQVFLVQISMNDIHKMYSD